MSTGWQRRLALGFLAAAVALVGSVLAWRFGAVGAAPSTAEHWPPARSAADSTAALRAACQRAASAQRLLLIEFSAPWCEHCGAVARATHDSLVRHDLDGLERIVVNIGEGDGLNALRLQLGARAIPYWTLIAPTRCSASPKAWPRLASTHPRGDPAAMARWLRETRPR